MADKYPAWATKRGPCVCGHGHAVKNPGDVVNGEKALYDKHCWAYYVASRCECNSHRPPVDPYYRHEPSHKAKTKNRPPSQNDSRGHRQNVVHVPMKLAISDAMLADPDFGSRQTMTLQQYHKLYGSAA